MPASIAAPSRWLSRQTFVVGAAIVVAACGSPFATSDQGGTSAAQTLGTTPTPTLTRRETPQGAGPSLTWDEVVTTIPAADPIELIVGRSAPSQLLVGLTGSGSVWRSSEDRSWQAAGTLPAGDPIRTVVTGAAFGSGRFVVVGFAAGPYNASIQLAAASLPPGVVWISADGTDWSRESPGRNVRLVSVTSDGSGYAALADNPDIGSGVARSDTGRNWVVDYPEVPGGFGPFDLESLSPGRYVAVGSGQSASCGYSPAAAIWVADGSGTWTAAAGDFGCGNVLEIARGPRGYIARGYVDTEAGGTEPRMWHSADGQVWGEGVPMPFGARAIGVAPDGTFVAVGDGIWESPDGVIWVLSVDVRGRIMRAYEDGVAIGCDESACVAWHLRP